MQSKDDLNLDYSISESVDPDLDEEVTALLEEYLGIPADLQELVQSYLDQKARRKRRAYRKRKHSSSRTSQSNKTK